MENNTGVFSTPVRIMHWLIAPLVFTMMIIGAWMVSTVSRYHELLINLHKPIGVMLLALVIIRIIIRINSSIPAVPATTPAWQTNAAQASHTVLYALLVVQPLLGWGMQSAGGYPVVLINGFSLPAIVTPSPLLYATLHLAHSTTAYALFSIILLHTGAALFHHLILRDGVLKSMLGWK